mmetsp:Transcript_28869/g.61272  ORF Transcript_28869/g.61272 Transcript_28869/m.61272 type:complete len:364 (-) Transcript_28869:145-1236(-)
MKMMTSFQSLRAIRPQHLPRGLFRPRVDGPSVFRRQQTHRMGHLAIKRFDLFAGVILQTGPLEAGIVSEGDRRRWIERGVGRGRGRWIGRRRRGNGGTEDHVPRRLGGQVLISRHSPRGIQPRFDGGVDVFVNLGPRRRGRGRRRGASPSVVGEQEAIAPNPTSTRRADVTGGVVGVAGQGSGPLEEDEGGAPFGEGGAEDDGDAGAHGVADHDDFVAGGGAGAGGTGGGFFEGAPPSDGVEELDDVISVFGQQLRRAVGRFVSREAVAREIEGDDFGGIVVVVIIVVVRSSRERAKEQRGQSVEGGGVVEPSVEAQYFSAGGDAVVEIPPTFHGESNAVGTRDACFECSYLRHDDDGGFGCR